MNENSWLAFIIEYLDIDIYTFLELSNSSVVYYYAVTNDHLALKKGKTENTPEKNDFYDLNTTHMLIRRQKSWG